MNTYTPNIKLAQPSIGDTGWSVPVNGNFTSLDALNPLGDLVVTSHEIPSSTLKIDVAPGSYFLGDGQIGTYAGSSGTTTLTASNTNYVFLDLTASGALSFNTTGFPATPHIRLATVVAGGTTLTSITDARQCFSPCGNPIVTDTDASTVTFDLSVTKTHMVTIAGSRTLVLANVQPGDKFDIVITQGSGGSHTVTWWSGLVWGGGSAPTLTTTAGKIDSFGFLCTSAGNYIDLYQKLNH